MRVLLVTSRVTFVPRNYDNVVLGLADCPAIAGLLILDNSSVSLMMKGPGLMLAGARRIGATLLQNLLGRSGARRRRHYGELGKPVWECASINDPAAIELIRQQGFDMIVNARTRDIYQAEVLGIPRLGCINIHHGLLPDQRGTM